MKITQITDLHIGNEGEQTYEVDVRNNFFHILEQINTHPPDHLVITGDLCYRTGQKEIYQWISEQLAALSFPYSVISGNHDNPELLAHAFGDDHLLSDNELYYRRDIGGQPCLFLDSTSAHISPPQLEWLATELSTLPGTVLIFVHHPPLPAGVPFMDNNHRLRNREELVRILRNHPAHIYTFSGHYHVEKTIVHQNVISYITPSCFMQIDQNSETFKVDHYHIGYREVVLKEDLLQSTVRYCKGARL